jgi:hypothetical protein
MIIRKVDRFASGGEGKTYDLHYAGIFVANVTLEPGKEMTRAMAFAIINDLLTADGFAQRKHIDRVTYAEAKPAIERIAIERKE